MDKSLECCLFNVSASGKYKSGYYACVTTTVCNKYADSIAPDIGKDIVKDLAKGDVKDIPKDVQKDIARDMARGRGTTTPAPLTVGTGAFSSTFAVASSMPLFDPIPNSTTTAPSNDTQSN